MKDLKHIITLNMAELSGPLSGKEPQRVHASGLDVLWAALLAWRGCKACPGESKAVGLADAWLCGSSWHLHPNTDLCFLEGCIPLLLRAM